MAYFGEGHESHMVYDFSLPPLVIDAFARQDTSYIKKSTAKTRPDLLFFEFLASHDGIGLLSAKEILSTKDFDRLLTLTKAHSGLISYDGSDSNDNPYELNISYFDAINDPNEDDDPGAVKRFIASQAIMLALKGTPGIYIHSLLGSRNYYQGVQESGEPRMINRERLPMADLEGALSQQTSRRSQVLEGFRNLLCAREKIRAFHSGERKNRNRV